MCKICYYLHLWVYITSHYIIYICINNILCFVQYTHRNRNTPSHVIIFHCITLHHISSRHKIYHISCTVYTRHRNTPLHVITLSYITLHPFASHHITLHNTVYHLLCAVFTQKEQHTIALHYISLHHTTSLYIRLHHVT